MYSKCQNMHFIIRFRLEFSFMQNIWSNYLVVRISGHLNRNYSKYYLATRDFFDVAVFAVNPLHCSHLTRSFTSLSATTEWGLIAPFTSHSRSFTITSAILKLSFPLSIPQRIAVNNA